MDRKQGFAIKLGFFLINVLVLAVIIYLYISNKLILEELYAVIFLQALICFLALFLYSIYRKFKILASNLGFRYLKGTFWHPKFEGTYKNNWWQIHFVSRDTGSQWGLPLTYIKLQWKEKKEFDNAKLSKHNNTDFRGNRIVAVKHIVRDYKNYLLLKRQWFTFDKDKVHELMDYLLKIEAESELKKNQHHK